VNILSINVGRPRDVEWRGKIGRTSIYKLPVAGKVRVNRLNIEGDQQADLRVHGGVNKAVYLYPSEHYAFWRQQFPGFDLPWGTFGENFTTTGVDEQTIHIGDRLRAGSAEFEVTQPRTPCFKLAMRFGRMDMIKRFLKSGRSGFYLAVTTEGDVAPNDELSIIASPAGAMTVAEAFSGMRTR
jgi:MOSC domain-containing protein YiiM